MVCRDAGGALLGLFGMWRRRRRGGGGKDDGPRRIPRVGGGVQRRCRFEVKKSAHGGEAAIGSYAGGVSRLGVGDVPDLDALIS